MRICLTSINLSNVFSKDMKTLTKDALVVASRQELIDQIQSMTAQIELFQNTISEMNFQIDWFKRQIFGAKSERFIPADDLQSALELDIVNKDEIDAITESTTITYKRDSKPSKAEPKSGHGRGPMPTHLPIKDVIIEPEGDLNGMVKLEDEVSWYFEMEQPGSLHVVRIIRPKYVRPKEDGVYIGNMPLLPVEKGNAGPGLMAQIIIDKYVYHLPLDRQRKKFKNEYLNSTPFLYTRFL